MPEIGRRALSRERTNVKKKLYGAIALLALVAMPALAEAATRGFATANVNMRSGPSTAYPAVVVIPEGAPLVIYGCLSDTPWCDVSFSRGRGWVAGRYVQAEYRQNRVYVEPRYYRDLGVPIITFDVGTYWDRYYRDRDFYRDRDRWSRPRPPRNDWGGPPPGWNRPPPPRPGDWNRPPPRPGDGDWNRPPPRPGDSNWNRPPPRPGDGNWNRPPLPRGPNDGRWEQRYGQEWDSGQRPPRRDDRRDDDQRSDNRRDDNRRDDNRRDPPRWSEDSRPGGNNGDQPRRQYDPDRQRGGANDRGEPCMPGMPGCRPSI